MSTIVKFNNRIGSRDISHMNLLIASVDDQTVIFPFEGKAIPGVVVIVSTRYEKNGKWSYNEWEVELAEGIRSFVWSQDWETSQYLNAGTWARAVEDVRRISGIPELCPRAIERFVRAKLPNKSRALDNAEAAKCADPSQALLDMIAAQDELSAARREEASLKLEISQMEAAEKARQEAIETRERVSKARQAMARGASLADIKALMA